MENKIRATAIAMILIAVYGMGMTAIGFVSSLLVEPPTPDELRGMRLPPFLAEVMEKYAESLQHGPSVFDVLWAMLSIAAMSFVIFAGIRLYQLRQRAVVMAGAIVLLIPCLSSCCCSCGLTLVIGVWTLFLLVDPQVKAAFKS
ncbi:MAG: hypothetical protein L6Q99_06820 [Planctomycetes bacterium]|nr:hypothetical protein [Planctomycetota bacterium]